MGGVVHMHFGFFLVSLPEPPHSGGMFGILSVALCTCVLSYYSGIGHHIPNSEEAARDVPFP